MRFFCADVVDLNGYGGCLDGARLDGASIEGVWMASNWLLLACFLAGNVQPPTSTDLAMA